MKQNIRLSLFALFLLLLASAKQTFALDNNLNSLQTSEADTAVDMANRVNDHRAESGLLPYTQNTALVQAAQQVADHMAATEFTSHYDAEGSSPSQRALQRGYTDHVTEIIYGGFGGVNAAWEWWTENELHDSLLLSTDYHEFGIGRAVGVDSGRVYWAIMFGTGTSADKTGTAVTPAIPGIVTKLPGTGVTAVPSPSPVAGQTPTQVLAAEDTAVSLTSLESDGTLESAVYIETATGGASTPTTAGSANEAEEDSTWLIVAAALTILFGVVFFYFPRAGQSRPKPQDRT